MLFCSGPVCRILRVIISDYPTKTYTNIQRTAGMRVETNDSNLICFLSLQGMANQFVELWVTTITGQTKKSKLSEPLKTCTVHWSLFLFWIVPLKRETLTGYNCIHDQDRHRHGATFHFRKSLEIGHGQGKGFGGFGTVHVMVIVVQISNHQRLFGGLPRQRW
jgi:hypothetical protein